MLRTSARVSVLATLLLSATLVAQQTAPPSPAPRPALGQEVTTPSGLKYHFTQFGKGPAPETGDLMVIHGIGKLTDGTEFWNTRTENAPYEYTLGVDSVIKGFSEGMRQVRQGDRVIITMTPDLAYGDRARTGIPANSTLVFDYEILAVKHLTVARLLRDGIAAGTVDQAIAKAKTTPRLKDYYVRVSSLQSVVGVANRKQAGDGERVLAFGITLMPKAYQLRQSLARAQAQRGAKAEAVKSYEAALKLNPNKTAGEKRDFETTTKAIADLKK